MSSGDRSARHVTVRDFVSRKASGEKLVLVSAYDALFARLAEEAGVDAVLVGDSLGNVVLGLDSTIPVTLEQMIHHGSAVRRGLSRAMLIVDMPFLTYQVNVESALRNCGKVMQRTGAEAVKLEGGDENVAAVTKALNRVGIPVMGHLGFTPQSVHALGGPRVQGKGDDAAARLIESAKRIEGAGAFAIVLELMPADVAGAITAAVRIPTIGIGAGPLCDGQVLVLMDLLGLNDRFSPRYLRKYATLADDVRSAVSAFRTDVVEGRYPDSEHSF
jgi:3-methyl-2-oxobutanoate hydroxymethyltransferase